MFQTTFLGHQGWLFQSKRACLLVDPLLCEAFGHTQALGYRVHPPRVLTDEAFPKIDAVVLTHEHDDHFDIPSLAKLDRKIPIHLSARSSIAARRILEEMGFAVHLLAPGAVITHGDLALHAFAGDHVGVNCGDEWDALPFLVRHTGGGGSFFSMVDITLTPTHVAWAQKCAPNPGLIGWTNNALDWSHMGSHMAPREAAIEDCFMKLGIAHELITSSWGVPQAMLFCAGGFAFEGERAWLNRHVFCVDVPLVCQMMERLYPKERFVATLPGQTFKLSHNKLDKIDARAPFLEVAPPDRWPARGMDPSAPVDDYGPATGRRTLDDAERARLGPALGEIARALVGGATFRSLCSLLEPEAGGRHLTFALALRDGDARHVFAYDASACAFVPGVADAEKAYLAGLTCWASDLLAIADGALGPIAITFGRARLWNALPGRFQPDLFGDLYRVSHPLARPAEFLRTYERLWTQSAGVVPSLFAR